MKIVIYGACRHRDLEKYGVDRRKGIKNIKSKYPIDFKIFVDENKSLSDETREIVGDQTEIIDVRHKPTQNLALLPSMLAPDPLRRRELGYRGMCLFYSSEFIHYLSGYDYAIRLDADSIVSSTLNIDNFIHSEMIHGYATDKLDYHAATRETLPNAIKKYVRENGIQILCDEEEINLSHFYSNFSIKKLDFWRSEQVVKFMNFIHSEDGIQKYRWGDHVLQANTLKMFCPKDKIIKLDFKYEHCSHGWNNH